MNYNKRRWQHRKELRKGTHVNTTLQRSWNKHGEDNFSFNILEIVKNEEELTHIEETYLIRCRYDPKCCNVLYSTLSSPAAHPDVRAKISASLKQKFSAAPWEHPRFGKAHTEESKRKISEAKTGHTYPDHHWKNGGMPQEVRDRIGATQRGVPKGPGRKISEEGMAKIRAAAEAGRYSHWKGRRHTEESRLKMSRPVRVTRADGSEEVFQSITALRLATGLTAATVHRALRSGTPIARGKFEGWGFSYVER